MDACRRGYASDAVALRKDPAKGLLGRENWVRWREVTNMQYWQSFEDLENFLPAILLIRTSNPGRISIRGLAPMAASGFGTRTFSQPRPIRMCTLTCLGWGLLLRAITFRLPGETAGLCLGGYREPQLRSPRSRKAE